MNDGVREHLCSLKYGMAEDAIQEIGRLGRRLKIKF